MPKNPRDKLTAELERIDTRVDDGTLTEAERDALREWANAVDSQTVRNKWRDADGRVQTLEPRSINSYLTTLRLCLERGIDLLECSAEDFNAGIDRFHDDRGLAKKTLTTYQCAGRSFYRYHNLGVDPDEILIYHVDNTARHDEQDMFTEADVEALRNACEGYRERALLELLIYTGQRIRAIQTLRLKDVDCQGGYLYLNDEVDGLKGALDRGRKRPLFGARKYVRDWKNAHPCKDDPNAWLFIGDPNHWRTDVSEPWDDEAMRQLLKRRAKQAGVDKPVNPHNFRHYFVTVMKRDYAMDSDTLRALLGTTVDSAVLDTVYSHVTNDDYVRKAEEQTGYRETESAASFTPDACSTCGELLEDHWRQCPACGETYAPELKQYETAVDEATSTAFEEFSERAQDLSPEAFKALRDVIDTLDEPARIDGDMAGDD